MRTKVPTTAFTECGGTMAANACVAIARLGGSAHYWGPVGADPCGERILADLAAEGVDAGTVRRVPRINVAFGGDSRPGRRRADGLRSQRPRA